MYLRVAALLYAFWQLFGHGLLGMSPLASLCLSLVRESNLGQGVCQILHCNQALPVRTILYHGDFGSHSGLRHLTKPVQVPVNRVLPPSRGLDSSAVDVCVLCTLIATIIQKAMLIISTLRRPIREHGNWPFTASASFPHPSGTPTSLL